MSTSTISPFEAAILAYIRDDKHLNGTDRNLMSDPFKVISDDLLANDPTHRPNMLKGLLSQADAEVVLKVNTNQSIPPPPKPRYVLSSFKASMASCPIIDWDIEKVATKGSFGVWFGDPGAAKSYSLLHYALSKAAGLSWLRHIVQQGGVAWIDEENGHNRTVQRIQEVARGLGLNPFLDIPFHHVSMACFNFGDPSDISEVEKILDETGADALIIDAFQDIMDGDENSTEDTKPALLACQRLATSRNIVVFLIHHTNRAGSFRGSSAIKGIPDLLVNVTKSTNGITFKSEKSRDAEPFEFSAVATWVPDALVPDKLTFRMVQTPTIVKPKSYPPSQQYVLDYLRANGASLVVDMVNAADVVSKASIHKAITSLKTIKQIIRCDDGKQGSKAMYQLIETADPIDIAMFQ